MAYEQQDNSGILFKNDRKTEAKQPDRTGSIRVAGKDYWLSGWVKKDKNDKPFMALSVTLKKAKPVEDKPVETEHDPFLVEF